MGARLCMGVVKKGAKCTGVPPTGTMTRGFWQPAALFLYEDDRKHWDAARMQQLTKVT
jgi:hypothetical protein